MKIQESQTIPFLMEGFSGQFYVPSEAKEGFNCLLVTVHERHPRTRVIDTTRVYFVIEGEGTFTINNDKETVSKNDLYIIKPGEEYEYEGKMLLLEFNVSPNNSFRDEIME